MSDENKTSFHIDLDSKEMAEGLETILEKIKQIGSGENMDGLVSALGKTAIPLGIVATGALACKVALDTVFDAEAIIKYNKQFDILARNVGLVGDQIRDGMRAQAHGLIDDLELVKAGSKAILELGDQSNKIPELLGLARQLTKVFGGEITENFEKLSMAIASGNQRALKHMGIIVDVEKAYRNYATANGLALSSLSEAGKRQALMNEVLAKSQTQLKGIGEKTDSATASWTRMKVAVKDLTEAVIVAIGTKMQPAVSSITAKLADLASHWKNLFIAAYGHGPEQAAASVGVVEKQIKNLQEQNANLERQKVFNPAGAQEYGQYIALNNKKIEELKTQLGGAKQKLEELHAEEKKEAAKVAVEHAPAKTSNVDLEKQKALTAKFELDIAKLREQRLAHEMSLTDSEVAIAAEGQAKILQTRQDTLAKIKQVEASPDFDPKQKAILKQQLEENQATQELLVREQTLKRRIELMRQQQAAEDDVQKVRDLNAQQEALMTEQNEMRKKAIIESDILSDKEKKMALLEQERMYQLEVANLRADALKKENQAIDNFTKHADTAGKKFGAGFAAGSQKAKLSLMDFGAQGGKIFNILGSRMTDAFVQMGEGSQKGSDVIKGAVMGMISDIAMQYGSMLLLTSIWPPNPLGLAAGAALLVLAGVTKSMANKSSGGMSGGGGVGGGGGDFGGGSFGGSQIADTGMMKETAKTPKSVHIEVHGSILDSDQTQRRLIELAMQGLDATDFAVRQIGSH